MRHLVANSNIKLDYFFLSIVSIPQDGTHQEVLLELEVPRNADDPNINLLPTNDILDQIVQNTT